MDKTNNSGYNGYSIASVLAGMARAGIIGMNDDGRIFVIPPVGPPPCDETLPTELIDWPEKK